MKTILLWCDEDECRRGTDLELTKEVGYGLEVRLDDDGVVLELLGDFVDYAVHHLTGLTPIFVEIDENRLAFSHQLSELVRRFELRRPVTAFEKTHGSILDAERSNLESLVALPA